MATGDLESAQTLMDLAAMMGPDNSILKIAEVLSKKTPIILTGAMFEANNVLSNVYGRRKSIASATWRKVGSGVAATASNMEQDEEPLALLEAISKIDVELIDNTGDKKKARWTYDQGYLQGMAQDFETGFWYGNQGTDPDQIDGLDVRYSSTSLTNVISAGGTGSDLMSIWLIDWGEMACHLSYPVASENLGIKIEDKGVQLVQDSSNQDFFAYVTRFVFRVGITVHDNRCVQRIANIESTGATHIFDPDHLVEAVNNLPGDTDRCAIYMNKTAKTQVDKDAMGRDNAYYTIENIYGRPVPAFWGIPIFKAGMLAITESVLT